MQQVAFPSKRAAYHFAQEAHQEGYKVQPPPVARPVTRRMLWVTLLGAAVGGSLGAILAALAEAGIVGLPRLEPLFAAPPGAVTTLFGVLGGCLGALVAGLAVLRPAQPVAHTPAVVTVDGEAHAGRVPVHQLIARHAGWANGHAGAGHGGEGPPQPAHPPQEPESQAQSQAQGYSGEDHAQTHRPSLNRILAWVLVVLTAGVILEATSYIWYLSIDYGHGADQQERIGYTLKNVQRIPADTPEQAGEALATIYGGETLNAAADPLTAALLAPLAASQGQTLVYGAGDAEPTPALIAQLAAQSNVAVIVAEEEAAYALPAAYAAALFRAPVIPLAWVGDVLEPGNDRLLLVAAPARLIADEVLEELAQYGQVERVAAENLHRHALLWARSRWGSFGWGIDENEVFDGYHNFTLANPEDPAFAAAGLPTAYLGNFGPLLYTPHDDLDELTDQYLWRIGPDFFAIPSDGPFINVRVVGGPQSVGYNAQARADLALETHTYRNQVAGASGMALLGWSWFFIGLTGAIWTLFAMPKRLPDSGFYPRLYWPLAMLVLGPVGIIAFFLVYQGRLVEAGQPMPTFVRPAWAQAIAATIMGMGVGMALMIASMYLFELNGLPLFRTLEYTPFFWLASPMAALMWFLMVVPAIVLSSFFFMGPMMGEMQGKGYWLGVRMAAPVVAWSMLSASLGMWTLAWWWMNWKPLMAAEDLWLWVTPLWWAAVMGFLTALIPNYLMVRTGWKHGGM